MRYKFYLRKLKTHERMHLSAPFILLGFSYKSDTFMRLIRYISSHNLCFDVRIYSREYEGVETSYEDFDYDPMDNAPWSD